MKKLDYKEINIDNKEDVLHAALNLAERYGELYGNTLLVDLNIDCIHIREEEFFEIFLPEEVEIVERESLPYPHKMIAYYDKHRIISLTSIQTKEQIMEELRETNKERTKELISDIKKIIEIVDWYHEIVSLPEFTSVGNGQIVITNKFFEKYPNKFDEYSFKQLHEYDDGAKLWLARLNGIDIRIIEKEWETFLDPYKLEIS